MPSARAPTVAWFLALLAVLFLALAGTVRAEVAVPPIKARVTDLTHTLTPAQSAALEGELAGIETSTGSQIAVLMLPSTQPETIEQYGLRVAEAWKLGKKGTDNGLVLLVAKNDRRMRIEVGYGLEGVIPDVLAKWVIEEDMAPRFKQGDYAGGLTSAVRRLGEAIAGRSATRQAVAPVSAAAPAPAAAPGTLAISRTATSKTTLGADGSTLLWILGGLALVGTVLRSLLGPLFGGLVMGGGVGVVAWFLSGTLMAALIAAGVAFVFVLVGISNWASIALNVSSGRGGGGFSGGGGGFGGGGASGSW